MEPRRGDLDDLDGLRRAAAEAGAVVHTAFNYDDWNAVAAAFEQEREAVSAVLEGLSGTGRAFVYTSGTGTLSDTGITLATEEPVTDPEPFVRVRAGLENQVLAAAADGVRGVVVRPGLVYGRGGSGIVNALIQLAAGAGIGRTMGAGENAWSAVHVDDLGELYAPPVEKAPAGSILHAVSGDPVPMRDIASAISRAMGRGSRTEAWPLDEARLHFPLADALASNKRASADRTRALLGWTPRQASITEDIEHGAYRDAIAAGAVPAIAS